MSVLLHLHGVLAIAILYVGYRTRHALLANPGDPLRARVRLWASCLLAGVAGLYGSGVVLYARYRETGGVRDWLLTEAPTWHAVWFEWKEHLGFFALACSAGLWLGARRDPGPGARAAALPLLATLLLALLAATAVGGFMSFFVRAVA